MTAIANARRLSRGLRPVHFAALPGAHADTAVAP
jgi:hypothetical protein